MQMTHLHHHNQSADAARHRAARRTAWWVAAFAFLFYGLAVLVHVVGR